MIQAVRLQRFRPVKDVVLVAQFVRDVFERLVQIFNLERKKRLAAGFIGEVAENLVAILILAGDVRGDRVDDRVGLLRHFESLITRHTALRVLAIADDDHGAAKFIARLIHHQLIFGRKINGVIERRATARTHAFHALFQFVEIAGEIADHLGRAVEADEHEPVLLWTNHALDETNRRLLFETKLLPNAVAGVYEHGQAQREIGFGGELLDDLRLLVFDDVEIGFREVSDETALFVRGSEEDVDACYVEGNARRVVRLAVWRGCFGNSGWIVLRQKHRGQTDGREAQQCQQGADAKQFHMESFYLLELSPRLRLGL